MKPAFSRAVGFVLSALVASPACAQTSECDACSVPPGPNPPPPPCGTWLVECIHNWQGPVVATEQGPAVEVLYERTWEYCFNGTLPCNFEPLQVSVQETERRLHRYEVGAQVTVEAALPLITALIAKARAGVQFNGTYANEHEHIYEVSLQFQVPPCWRMHYRDTIERWTSNGSMDTAEYRAEWINDCILDSPMVQYCGYQRVSGNAIGFTNRRSTMTPEPCGPACVLCPDH